MYKFDNYKEEYLEAQHELVTSFSEQQQWKWFGYPTVDQLRQTYSAENFTPDTRHYAFDGDKLVGFVSSAVGNTETGNTNLQYPFVRTGFEDIQRDLMDHALRKLREKGGKVVQTNVPEHWTGAGETLTRLGFEKGDVTARQLNIITSEFDFSDYTSDDFLLFTEVDPVADREALIKVFQTEMTQTADQIGQIIDQWPDAQNLIYNTIAKVEGEIVTHSMVFKNPQQNMATMTHISVYDDNYSHLREVQFKYMLQRLKEDGYEKVRIFALPEDAEELYGFSDMKLHYIHQYQLQL